jgi:hypothetical protein
MAALEQVAAKIDKAEDQQQRNAKNKAPTHRAHRQQGTERLRSHSTWNT